MFKIGKIKCNKINEEVNLIFDIINTSTISKPNQKQIGLARACSGVKNICKDCQIIKDLKDLPIQI